MTRWQTQRIGSQVVQAGIPFRARASSYYKMGGLLLRGVITATYEVDNPHHPVVDRDPNATAVAIYCDVLCYSSMQGQRWQYLKQVLVSQEIGGMHRGKIYRPRAAKLDVTGNAIDLDRATNPANLDGDHVLVGFYDDNPNTPVIIRGIPHPSNDIGNEDKDLGHRMKLKQTDGDPDFWKHHGSYFGISDSGDFVIDTTLANDGLLEDDGKEKAAAEDGTVGNFIARLQKGTTVTIEIDGDNFKLELSDDAAKLTLGDGAMSAAVAEHLETLYDLLKTYIEGAIVPTGVGPSGTILVGSGPAPSWDPNIVSDKLKLPDTGP